MLKEIKKFPSIRQSNDAVTSHDTCILGWVLFLGTRDRPQHAIHEASHGIMWGASPGKDRGRHGRWPSVTRERSYGIINDEEATQTWVKRDIPRRRLWWRGCVVPLATTAVVPAVCHYQNRVGHGRHRLVVKKHFKGMTRTWDMGEEGGKGKKEKEWERESVRRSTKLSAVTSHLNVTTHRSSANHY